MKNSLACPAHLASQFISEHIGTLGDWRTNALTEIRQTILSVDSRIVEEFKWEGTPVWSKNGILCIGESYPDHLQITFVRGALIPDPKNIFNANLDSKTKRSIKMYAPNELAKQDFIEIIKRAITANNRQKK